MKLCLHPLLEKKSLDCDYFTPKYYFEADWSLDMHGFLTREELDARIDEINRIVEKNPLLSERAKKGILFAFILFTFIVILFLISTGSYIAPASIELLFVLAGFLARFLINKEAKRRAKKFSNAIGELFDSYNVHDNPTANWKLKWRKVLSHFKTKTTNTKHGSEGKIKPMYAEQAEIVLEISDSLANITECTVSVNLHELGKLDRILSQKSKLEGLLSDRK